MSEGDHRRTESEQPVFQQGPIESFADETDPSALFDDHQAASTHPGLGVIIADEEDISGSISTIAQAKQEDIPVFIAAWGLPEDSALTHFIDQTDINLVEVDHRSNPREKLMIAARISGCPGLIIYEPSMGAIDFDASIEALLSTTEFTVNAVSGPSQRSDEVIVGIPAYNEEVGIGSIVVAAKQYADEVVVVDDGSHDNTAKYAEAAGAKVINHGENKGKGAAIQTFFEYISERTFGAAVLMDGDGQHSPKDIPEVTDPVIKHDADIVIGSRYLDQTAEDETPAHRRFGQRILDILTIGASRRQVTDSQSGFRAFTPGAVEEMSLTADNFGAESEMINLAAESDLRIEERSIEVRYDGIDGQTQHPLQHGLSVVMFILRMIRDRHPLLSFGIPGILLTTLGMLFGIQGILIYQSTGNFYPAKALASGFITMFGILSLFTGLILHRITHIVQSVR